MFDEAVIICGSILASCLLASFLMGSFGPLVVGVLATWVVFGFASGLAGGGKR